VTGAAAVLWVFVDGLGLSPPPLRAAGSTPRLDAMLRGAALVDAPLAPTALARRFALDATLGVEGRPGTATGQATLVTGRNASLAMGRHMQAYPGPRLRAWMDEVGSLFGRALADGLKTALITSYPTDVPDTALRYAARTGGAHLADGAGTGVRLYPNLGMRPAADAHRDPSIAAASAALAARLARPYDLSVIETDLCDRAGHLRQGRAGAVARAIAFIDAFVAFLRAELAPDDLLVVASDHGNAEDAAERGHTRARVPVFALAPAAGVDLGALDGDLTAFAPWLESLTGRLRGGR
jgi:2,3-bisphosphoglycerate-independent phosphoglycerate mutase